MQMQQQIAVITLGISDLARSTRFYRDGFGWRPVFESDEIAFYQMNGFVFGTSLTPTLEEETGVTCLGAPGAVALAHNVRSEGDVQDVMDRLLAAGATLLRGAEAPPQGGRRGYVADPDGHMWEIAWNPSWPIDADGHVTFAP
ncbi:VOC family protein [Roseivivax isoporae]|uniref:Glyoxalase n=1 Tax=Roseivivax isoporae LMG 25204 TaxID=1449351 RepID=X7F3W5_9RHOB|nr:VOC family protein [Roseivivax isoporae]ETX27582.1 glyoxalase [Roseivivax isoporae LMG 25204]